MTFFPDNFFFVIQRSWRVLHNSVANFFSFSRRIESIYEFVTRNEEIYCSTSGGEGVSDTYEYERETTILEESFASFAVEVVGILLRLRYFSLRERVIEIDLLVFRLDSIIQTKYDFISLHVKGRNLFWKERKLSHVEQMMLVNHSCE